MMSLIVSLLLLPKLLTAASTICSTGLTGVYINGMAVDASGQYGYINGLSTSTVLDQPFGGRSDALLIKVMMSNCSVVWTRAVGGNYQDFGGAVLYAQYNIYYQQGVAMSAKDGIVMWPLTFASTNIPGLTTTGISTAVVIHRLNGTFVQYVTGMAGVQNAYHFDLKYSALTSSFFFAFDSYDYFVDDIWQIWPNGSRSIAHSQRSDSTCYTLAINGVDMICSGAMKYNTFGQNDWYVQRYSLSNLSLTFTGWYGSVSDDLILATTIDAITNALYIAGYIHGPFKGYYDGKNYNSLDGGTGALTTARFDLGNNSLTILTRYTNQLSDQGASGIQYDSATGILVVSGYVYGAPYAQYGSYDATVLVYSRNLSIVSNTVFGSSGDDAGSIVSLPYVVLSTINSWAGTDGSSGVGPALVKIDLSQYSLVSASSIISTRSQSSSTTTIATSLYSSNLLSSGSIASSLPTSTLRAITATSTTTTTSLTLTASTSKSSLNIQSRSVSSTLESASSATSTIVTISQIGLAATASTSNIVIGFTNSGTLTISTSVLMSSTSTRYSFTTSSIKSNGVVTSTSVAQVSSARQVNGASASHSSDVTFEQILPVTQDIKTQQSDVRLTSSKSTLGDSKQQVSDIVVGFTLINLVTIAIGLLGLIFGCIAIVCVLRIRRQRNSRKRGSMDGTKSTAAIGSTTESSATSNQASMRVQPTPTRADTTMSLSTTQMGATTLVGAQEMSLPGHLEVQNGIDFNIDMSLAPIAKGGGGTICVGNWQNYGRGLLMLQQNQQQCAVKAVHNTTADVFRQEVALMFYFRDTDTIIELLGFNAKDMTILMPLFQLGPLSRVLTDHPQELWTTQVVLQLAMDVFTALSTIHDAGVVHNDVKSANYLVRHGMRAVLTDFGVCRVLSSAVVVSGLVVNSVHGKTIRYASPELLDKNGNAHHHDHRYHTARDVYAGSLIVNELLTRHLAWDTVTRNEEVVQSVLAGQRPPMAAAAAQDATTRQLQQVVTQGWSQDPAARPTARAILELLTTTLPRA